MTDIAKLLDELSTEPADEEAFNRWLSLRDAIAFLGNNVSQEEFVVYSNTPHCYLHAVAVPKAVVNPPNADDLLMWNCNAYSGWGVQIGFAPPTIQIVPPLYDTGSVSINGGEQLVFARSFEGRTGDKHYHEILPKYLHISGLHFLRERNAYCKLDKHGDIEESIRIIDLPAQGGTYGGTIVTFERAALDEYLALTDSTVVRMFDFMRFRQSDFRGWSGGNDIRQVEGQELFYRHHIEPGHASYIRGCQIVHPLATKQTLLERYSRPAGEERQHASFIALDWKHNVVREISCAPGQLGNYFVPSPLPFETTPAFFRAEVLSKYKADSDKYNLNDRSITCRGAWHLQSYDINEAGQVHTYLVYLRNLPYEEQLYWKSYNEAPKGTISRRAYKTDFEGCWDLEYDPLANIKNALQALTQEPVPWWTLRSKRAVDRVHYPVTPSADEWANELLHLDQLVVEGFETKWLRNKAQALGRSIEASLKSLTLILECLMAIGFTKDDASNIVAPLQRLHQLRSKLKGHAAGDEALSIREQVLSEHQSYGKHFRVLCEKCDHSIRAITKAFEGFS